MTESEFIKQHKIIPSQTNFEDSIAIIEQNYTFDPVAFRVGKQKNEAGTNLGSCKIFAFAQKHGLSKDETLQLFGRFYREDVLYNPSGSDHQNIRNFMLVGWDETVFEGQPLTRK